jgi:folate-dependent phosphoribosylglycinamide formyltransferase PurN
MPKIILLTTPRVDCRWLAAKLSERITLSMVVFEHKGSSMRYRWTRFWRRLGELAKLTLLPWNGGTLALMYRLGKIDKRLKQQVLAKVPRVERERVRGELPVPSRTFASLNSPEAITFLREQKPDLLLTFGVSILKPDVIAIPPLGIINAHPALLPAYRGTMSQFLQLLNEDYASSGVTIHFIDAGVDTGDIVLQRATPTGRSDTPPGLYFKNLTAIVELFPKAVAQILDGTVQRTPQGKTDQPTFRRRDVTPAMRATLYRRLGLM